MTADPTPVTIRPAVPTDGPEMAALLNAIIRAAAPRRSNAPMPSMPTMR